MKTNPFLQAAFIIGERLIYLVPQVAIFVLISRYLGREVFGQYSLVLTWAMLFQTLANFGITECLGREIGREPQRASTYFTHGLVLAIGFAAAAMALMAPAAWLMQYRSDITRAILLAGGTLLPAGVVGVCRGVLLANRKVEYMTAVGLVETLILLPLNVYWIVTHAGLLPIVATIVVAKVGAGALALALVHFRVTPACLPLQRDIFRQLWRITWPIGIAGQLPALRFDIFLLSKMTTFATLGLYSAASKVAELLLIFPLAFYLTMLPRVAGDLTEKPARTAQLNEALAWYFALVIPLGLGVVGLAEPILRLVYGSTFVVAAPLLQIQSVAFLVTTIDVVLMMLCRATGFQRADLRFVFISTLANLVLNVALIPAFAAIGAALAMVLSFFIGLVLHWRLVTRSVTRLSWGKLIGAPFAASLFLVPVLLALIGRIAWPFLALGYMVVYATIALTSFPFVHVAVKRVWRQQRISTG